MQILGNITSWIQSTRKQYTHIQQNLYDDDVGEHMGLSFECQCYIYNVIQPNLPILLMNYNK